MAYKRQPLVGEALTPREHAVARLLVDGHSNKIIADRLGISRHTAKFHVYNVLAKLGDGSRVKAAVAYARQLDAVATRILVANAYRDDYCAT